MWDILLPQHLKIKWLWMLVDYCFYCRWFDIEHLRLSPSRSANEWSLGQSTPWCCLWARNLFLLDNSIVALLGEEGALKLSLVLLYFPKVTGGKCLWFYHSDISGFLGLRTHLCMCLISLYFQRHKHRLVLRDCTKE